LSTVLGLIGIVFFIASVIALAYTITWAVVRISPTGKKKPEST
jgi:hypothetical protein